MMNYKKLVVTPNAFGYLFDPDRPDLNLDELNTSEAENYFEEITENKKANDGYQSRRQTMNDAEEAIHTLVRLYNNGSKAAVFFGIVRALSKTHRTLQQDFMKYVIYPVLSWFVWAHKQDHFDARNIGACNLSHDLKEKMDDPENFLGII